MYIYYNGMKLTVMNAGVALGNGDKEDDEPVTRPSSIVIGSSKSLSLILSGGASPSLILGGGASSPLILGGGALLSLVLGGGGAS